MSDQLTSQSRPSSGISRRTALRGAAWSASAVTVVVAAPAHANTSPGATPTGTASTNGSTRDGSRLNLNSLFTAGPQQVSGLTATVTVGTGTIDTITTPAGWTRTGLSGSTATFTYTGTVAGGAAVPFAPVVTLTSNPTSTVTSTVGFSWTTTGSAAVSIPLAYVAPAAAIVSGSIRKYNDSVTPSLKHVEWKLTVTNTSTTQTLAPLKLDFEWSADVAGNRATRFTVVTPNRTWTTTLGELKAVLGGSGLAPGESMSVTADFVNPKDNASGWINVEVFSGDVSAHKTSNIGY